MSEQRTKAIHDLLQAHQAVLLNVKSLVLSIDDLDTVTDTAISKNETKIIYDGLRNLRVALFYMKDGMINHENLDKESLKDLVNEHQLKLFLSEHGQIAQLLDKMYDRLYQMEKTDCSNEIMKENTKVIKQNINDFQFLVTTHINKEDEFLKNVLPN
jgi:hypothetical protein